jgi:hypothetical protein
VDASDARARPRTLSERTVSQALGIELLELNALEE